MTEGEAREPPRQVWHFALLVVAILTLCASQLFGSRPLMWGAFNNVAAAGIAPSVLAPDDWSLTIHRSDWRLPFAAALGYLAPDRPARLGWVVREWSLLSLPIAGWRQSEVAVFREDGYGYRLAGLTEDQRRALDARVGWFPWWRHLWGWLPLLAFAGFVWGELRWQARRREALGVM